ncbi:Uma2 family endonuclease [Microcoleus sp. FACHB-1515]|uniref:Uma2 family endonuclease n=1 Tax=Cyanophyceae TaxID=3028117 RepID=UPI0016879A75|nr:Uma2 family endonuclease [Microcoleus sp. FACHB-1515]MBD2088658.1 Uma2 family endonuclease [Microcoleus sp. FACHB-1515]
MTAYTINFNSVFEMTDEQFYQLCRANPEVKFERNTKGELIIMPPTGGETGKRNASLTARFVIWNEQSKLGVVFDSSTCFKLPTGTERSPDVAWIRQDRWDALTPEQKEKFPPIAPDFVLELLSPSDRLNDVQAKLKEYIDSGVKLGWLIDPQTQRVEIHRPNGATEILEKPATLSDEIVLPGFVLNLEFLWD